MAKKRKRKFLSATTSKISKNYRKKNENKKEEED